MGIGILGIGVHLPQTVRYNDWWPQDVVTGWQDAASTKVAARMTSQQSQPESSDLSPGALRVLAGIAKFADDPFRGTRERRVMDSQDTSISLELQAAQKAITNAKVSPSDIGGVLTFSFCPDYLSAPSSATLRQRLGLPASAFATEINSVCNSFHAQLSIAEAFIRANRAQYVLLVQCSAMSRMGILADPSSAWFGDGATAVVVGHVEEGFGILASSHRSDGSLHKSLVHGVPGKRWFDEGKVEMYTEDRAASRRMLLMIADQAHEVVNEALASAGLSIKDVDFYAGHQSTSWMLETIQEHLGATHAKSVETFSWTGTLSAANIPFALATAVERGSLAAGDIIATFAPGTGMTYSSYVIRWSANCEERARTDGGGFLSSL